MNLDSIPPEGLALELNVSAADMSKILADGEKTPLIVSPLRGELFLRPLRGERLSIKGAFTVTAEIICDRCLADTPAELVGSVNELLDLVSIGAQLKELAPDEDNEADGELEVVNGQVDLSGLLGELFWVAWPLYFICKPDCAGLCPRCGADLNDGLCACVDGCGKS